MPHSMEAVRQGWIHILNQYKWDWFVTVTFANEWIHPEAADKKWRLWCSKLNRKLYGPRWYKKRKEIHWVRALEYHKSGVPHFHALMAHPADLNQLMSRMEQVSDLAKFAGWSRIYPPRCQDAVAAYCSKYITKGGELDVSPFLPICDPVITATAQQPFKTREPENKPERVKEYERKHYRTEQPKLPGLIKIADLRNQVEANQ